MPVIHGRAQRSATSPCPRTAAAWPWWPPDVAGYRNLVYNLAAGTQRSYHPAGAGDPYTGGNAAVPVTPNTLSWGADNRTPAFVWRAWTGGGGVRLLDTNRPGSGLLANSRVAIPWSRTTWWTQIQLAADGGAIFANVDNPDQGGTSSISRNSRPRPGSSSAYST